MRGFAPMFQSSYSVFIIRRAWHAIIRGAAYTEPVAHHSALGKRERKKHADCIQGYQATRVAPKRNYQHRSEYRKDDDAVREDEFVSARGKLSRQKPIAREQTGETRKIRE